MTLTPDQENAKALAVLLGIEEDDAAQRLKFRVAVNLDPVSETSRELGSHVIAILNRTIEYAGIPDHSAFAVEVIIGPRAPATSAPIRVYAGQHGTDFVVDGSGPLSSCDPSTPPSLLVIAACYIAAAAVRVALGNGFPIQTSGPIVLPWTELFGPDLKKLMLPLDIGESYLAGAGAVGHGFVYALRYFDVRGTLYITDPKKVTPGGLNRCLLFDASDLGHPKASRLCEVVQTRFPKLALVPVDATLDEARKSRGADFLIQHLVVSVDSRRARRSLQSELPGAVFDASTTGITEVVLHFNRQPTDLACLSCVYPESDRERKHEENVAEALGLTVQDVRQGFIDSAIAARICARYPDLQTGDLVGRAFDTVYKELCGIGKLKSVGGQQVLAPFSFVSVMAGAYLAVEFALRIRGAGNTRFNYWRVSPWHSPVSALRQMRPRDLHCEFCSNPALRRVMQQLWSLPPDRSSLDKS
jgi:molybdopterin/thiamine biosynthesis adenylyltransferase